MKEEETKRLEELRWLHERNSKKIMLNEELKNLLPTDTYSFLSIQDSDNIQLEGHGWPDDKWSNNLYVQTPNSNSELIASLVNRFIEVNSRDVCYVFFMHYNFGLVEIKNEMLANHWQELIDLDGDEIFCYIPERPEFICIEKKEEAIVGKEKDGRHWIYEVTFSSKEFKSELKINVT